MSTGPRTELQFTIDVMYITLSLFPRQLLYSSKRAFFFSGYFANISPYYCLGS